MPGKILIVDDLPTNRILLRVRLEAASYDVIQSGSSAEALGMIAQHCPDLVLISANLGEGESLALCRHITGLMPPLPDAAADTTADTTADAAICPAPGGDLPVSAATLPGDGTPVPPVLILSARTDRRLRLAALDAGAVDVLAFPLDDMLLQARLRSLMRVGDTAPDNHLHQSAGSDLGFAEAAADFRPPPRICVLSDHAPQDPVAEQAWLALRQGLTQGRITHHDSRHFLREVSAGDTPDLCLVVMERPLATPGLRLLSELRAHPETRHSAILLILPARDNLIAADALDLGAGDVMSGLIDPAELTVRVGSLIRRKRMADQMRSTLRDGLRAAVTDPLTGLYNRRYALPYLVRMTEQARRSDRHFAVMLADLDHFKGINDRFGHAAGDAVLVEVAHRLRSNLRAVDLVARLGGEEFLIALPDTDRTEARVAARRLCRIIGQDPFTLPGQVAKVPVTISIGVAMGHRPPVADVHPAPRPAPKQRDHAMIASSLDALPDAVQFLLQQADRALYGAKACGRNQVTIGKPAA